jgi:cystathionine gamma-lyase
MDDMADRVARMLHHRASALRLGDPVAPPLVPATTFHLPGTEVPRYSYGRSAQPTWDVVEDQLAILEGAEVVAFPSGMAAITAALFACLKTGDRVVIPSDGYYATRLLGQVLGTFGVSVTEVPTASYAAAEFAGASVVYVETPSNPGLDVVNLTDTVARAHAAGAKVVVDNTAMTPFLQRPLDFGADLVVAADTKAPAGHSDVLFGHVAGRDAALTAKVRDWRRISGAIPGPFEAWLVHRGLETLEVRLSRMCASAQIIAARLGADPRVRGLRYPGLPYDPSHAIAARQMSGFGFLIGFELEGQAEADAFLDACPFVAQTTSFGGTHTSAERRARWGDAVAPGFLRLSVGVEPVEPLWAAIARALVA